MKESKTYELKGFVTKYPLNLPSSLMKTWASYSRYEFERNVQAFNLGGTAEALSSFIQGDEWAFFVLLTWVVTV
ncbi:hypothetical protein D8M04_08565 [Oceanobacillus piezotolerans]|uniref:Uncharacterized protein n=1 Tax=Oceanobacillus piezotolerans TaxID=2448030 RepID=A0A498DMC8_9BACI|nr:hypothetical protein D8M04_08565 [Oceanobacillus piezotolerans]